MHIIYHLGRFICVLLLLPFYLNQFIKNTSHFHSLQFRMSEWTIVNAYGFLFISRWNITAAHKTIHSYTFNLCSQIKNAQHTHTHAQTKVYKEHFLYVTVIVNVFVHSQYGTNCLYLYKCLLLLYVWTNAQTVHVSRIMCPFDSIRKRFSFEMCRLLLFFLYSILLFLCFSLKWSV